MITITETKTQLAINLEKIDAPLKRIEARTKANAADLNASFNAFWKLPEDQILEVLNHYGPAKVQEVFGAHAKYAVGMNELLADRGIASIANVVAPRELVIVDGLFELVPLPEPELAPEDPIE